MKTRKTLYQSPETVEVLLFTETSIAVGSLKNLKNKDVVDEDDFEID